MTANYVQKSLLSRHVSLCRSTGDTMQRPVFELMFATAVLDSTTLRTAEQLIRLATHRALLLEIYVEPVVHDTHFTEQPTYIWMWMQDAVTHAPRAPPLQELRDIEAVVGLVAHIAQLARDVAAHEAVVVHLHLAALEQAVAHQLLRHGGAARGIDDGGVRVREENGRVGTTHADEGHGIDLVGRPVLVARSLEERAHATRGGGPLIEHDLFLGVAQLIGLVTLVRIHAHEVRAPCCETLLSTWL